MDAGDPNPLVDVARGKRISLYRDCMGLFAAKGPFRVELAERGHVESGQMSAKRFKAANFQVTLACDAKVDAVLKGALVPPC